MTNTDALLSERGKTHGSFKVHARITQDIKNAMKVYGSWNRLQDHEKEALEMITHKIGRILAGNPRHKDHWDDIAGYARLVSIELEQQDAQ